MKQLFLTILMVGGLTAISCNKTETNTNTTESKDRSFDVVTEDEQKALTPDQVLSDLKNGNENFATGNYSNEDYLKEAKETSKGQYPKAVVLSCLDSRVPVETVFNQGIGDLFVGRVAGNIEDEDIIGSFEFGTAVAGAKLVVVLGHTSCGAVKHAIDQTDAKGLGMVALHNLLDKIQPAVNQVLKPGQKRDSHDKELLKNATNQNVLNTIADLRKNSPTLSKLEKEGKIKIVGGVYDLESGKVTWL